jgi:ABC-type Fe3+ transport system substrate-binding protein
MKVRFLTKTMSLGFIASWVLATNSLSAEPNTALLKARKDAEAKGYIFEASHNEIETKARKEGELRILYGLGPETMKLLAEDFVKKYSFIKIRRLEEIAGEDASRFIAELETGRERGNWDVIHIAQSSYTTYFRHLAKYDLFGMAEKGVLQIPSQMVDPANRNVLAPGSSLAASAYNPTLLSAELVPKTWEDLLRPQLKGRKFALDIKPSAFAGLVPVWGREKVIKFARQLKEQEPIFGRGHSRMLSAVVAGEYAMHATTHYHTAMRLKMKTPAGRLQVVLVEPVPVRLHAPQSIMRTARNPNAALLWLEHLASPEGQKVLDEVELRSSVFGRGSSLNKAVEGKKLSIAGWDYFYQREDIEEEILKEYGFPTAK